MKSITVRSAALLMLGIGTITSLFSEEGSAMAKTPLLTEKSIYEFAVKDIDGKEVVLESYRGTAMLIVNVASKCGFTPQYAGLEKMYRQYKDQGFVVLGFPANNFMWQEPLTDGEIKNFCSLKYNVTFPMFSKISVKGKDKHPLYRFLTEKESNPQFHGEVKWNFSKFLIDKKGNIIARFGSSVTPESDEVQKAIEMALKQAL